MSDTQLLNGIKDTIVSGSQSDAVNLLRQYQIDHYTERLEQARIQGNDGAVSFLRTELFNLKKQPCES